MSSLILPVTIESRKIIFVDLTFEIRSPESDPGEDEYIIEIPSLHDEEALFTISKKKTIQSLIGSRPDISLDKIILSCNYDKEKRVLDFILKENGANESASRNEKKSEQLISEVELMAGLNLQIVAGNEELSAAMLLTDRYQGGDCDPLLTRFIFEFDPTTRYSAIVRFYPVNKLNIQFAGLDFGSEASQLSDGAYDPVNTSRLNTKSFDLFTGIKRYIHKGEADKMPNANFIQFLENVKLYKSEFYVKEELNEQAANSSANVSSLFPDSLNVLTLIQGEQDFIKKWVQIPNLKIIHGNPDFASKLTFKVGNAEDRTTRSLADLKDSIYTGLLEYMIKSYLKANIERAVFLRFTLLVPNIYTIQEIIHAKKTIRKIINNAKKDGLKGTIKALEISTLSESDASFLGCKQYTNITAGEFYIVIDCGKGTTDFSIIQSEQENSKLFRSVYRSGFAGAGNLISFAFLQSVLHYMLNSRTDNGVFQRNLKTFLTIQLGDGPETYFRKSLYKRVEFWKERYSVNTTQENAEDKWNQALVGTRHWNQLFENPPSNAEVLEFLNGISYVHDWGRHIETAVAEITGKICKNIEQAMVPLKSSKCGGVLFTGRGFLFKPLHNSLIDSLQAIKGLENVKLLNNDKFSLKEVCMDGIFTRAVVSYSDTASTPIEIRKDTGNQVKKTDIKVDSLISFWYKIKAVIESRFMNKETNRYNDDFNFLDVVNTDFLNCQFLVGGKTMYPHYNGTKKITKARLIQAREGIFIRLTTKDGNDRIIHVNEVVQSSGSSDANSSNVLKSLFPGWLEASLLGINK